MASVIRLTIVCTELNYFLMAAAVSSMGTTPPHLAPSNQFLSQLLTPCGLLDLEVKLELGARTSMASGDTFLLSEHFLKEGSRDHSEGNLHQDTESSPQGLSLTHLPKCCWSAPRLMAKALHRLQS
jgi:hypothetical protein